MPRRYTNIEQLTSDDGRRYRTNSIYPDIPESPDDIYVITTGGDRYDTLARQLSWLGIDKDTYGDSSLWWVIASANNSKKDGLIVEQGIQLRIPARSTNVQGLFETLNRNR